MDKKAQDFEQNQRENAVKLEGCIEKYVRNHGYTVKKLDKANRAYKAPDYLFYPTGMMGKAFFCECKYINSVDYNDQQCRISTLDGDFMKNTFLKNGATFQLDCNKFQDAVIEKARCARRKRDDFVKKGCMYKNIYQGHNAPLVLCLDVDLAIKGFVKPVISSIKVKLGEYIDAVALYRPKSYEKPPEMVNEEDSSGLSAKDGATIKELGAVSVPLFKKYAGKILYGNLFVFLATSKLGEECLRNGCWVG